MAAFGGSVVGVWTAWSWDVAQKGVTNELEEGDDGDFLNLDHSLKKNQHRVGAKFAGGIIGETSQALLSVGHVDILRRFIFGKYVAFLRNVNY
jgi:hypothetical protein